jgi:hypothetical protein
MLEFMAAYGRNVVLRGMDNDAPRIVSTKLMLGTFNHGDVAYETKCLITSHKPLDSNQQYQVDIQTLLRKHERVFGEIPLGRPPDRGF